MSLRTTYEIVSSSEGKSTDAYRRRPAYRISCTVLCEDIIDVSP